MADNLLATQLRKGMIVKIDNKLFRIFDRQHVTPGNLRGFVRVKMRNIQNGSMAEEKFRSIFENAIEGIFQTTPEGRFKSANPALARIYGYDSSEELIRQLSDIEQPAHRAADHAAELIDMARQAGEELGAHGIVHEATELATLTGRT